MRTGTLLAALAATMMTAAPALAAAPTTVSAAHLSVAKHARSAGSPTRDSRLAGGGLVAAIMGAVLVGAIVVAISTDDDGADSN